MEKKWAIKRSSRDEKIKLINPRYETIIIFFFFSLFFFFHFLPLPRGQQLLPIAIFTPFVTQTTLQLVQKRKPMRAYASARFIHCDYPLENPTCRDKIPWKIWAGAGLLLLYFLLLCIYFLGVEKLAARCVTRARLIYTWKETSTY